MIYNMDFKPVVKEISLQQGDGVQYASHVSEIIDEVITNFIIHLSEVQETKIDDEELLYNQASKVIEQWFKFMREEVNNKNQSVTWAKNVLILLAKTLDSVKDWHPHIMILDKQLKSILPKHYKFDK